jgi:hypothetical protein
MAYAEKFTLDGKYDWRVMELTDLEVEGVSLKHDQVSKKIMDNAYEDAKELCKTTEHDLNLIAIALFQSRCPTLYGMMQDKIHEKIKKVVPKQYFNYDAYLISLSEKEDDKKW